jgi:hypothetical protein
MILWSGLRGCDPQNNITKPSGYNANAQRPVIALIMVNAHAKPRAIAHADDGRRRYFL